MVFNSVIVIAVAHVSADAWQFISCIPSSERINSHQLLDIVFCLPLQQLGRFALCLWTFLCHPTPDSFYSYSYYDSSSSSDSDYDYDYHHVHHHAAAAAAASSSSTVDLDDYYYQSHSD